MNKIESMKSKIITYTTDLSLSFKGIENPWDTIPLYHGTTSKYLNDILRNGIVPRKNSAHHNFQESPSNEHLVYLSNKWHYWYAYHSNKESIIRKVGQKRYETESIGALWNETNDFPIYVCCDIPKELLTLDEDVVYQFDVKHKINSGFIKEPSDISISDCLAQGTIASLKEIDPIYINEIVILGSPEYRDELLEGQYGAEANNWFNGWGLGDMTRADLSTLELMKYHNQIEVLEYEYPADKNNLVENIVLLGDNLIISFKS
ncbi:hypothetical protein G3A_17445 [Bacillus sp. 17376]|uniref:Uncharacterized protein n=1 Tax=Mesobacillus boroniphilus JCM 21738 TaxID=1294265 RepID=W4RWV8_9BACI|nr:hypothetical protein [Mesobacillus boroniphilus]ESU31293.1 hypothetical protein G3A_17445 [Bacillus sp. 17376]GAE48134.1 hypothetical protein JCM21738_5214 [Mesobacillus boroniphilus JCM 21738]